MLATLRLAQRSTEVVRPRQALLAAPSVRASYTSQAMKRSLIGPANKHFRHEQPSRSDLQLRLGWKRPVGAPNFVSCYSHVASYDINISPEAVLPDQIALPWLLSALRMISNQQNALKIS